VFSGVVILEATAQNGNEWINFNQQYYRIPVAANGLYRVTHNDLLQAGFPVNTVDPRMLQLFHRGTEQAIHVEGEGDGQLHPDDYIEFYGRKNDGSTDTELYKPASAQPHTYYNLFSDTTVYFLTYNHASPGKRMPKIWKDNTANLPAEEYHSDEKLMVLTQEHSLGMAYSTQVRTTFFDVGEGWTGQFVTQNNVRDYTLEGISNTVPSSGLPHLEVLVAGRSGVVQPHVAEIYAGPSDASLRLIASQEIYEFEFAKISEALNWSDIGGDGKLVVRLRVLASGATARVSISYIRLTYPQNFDAAGSSEKLFHLPENPSGESLITVQNPPIGGRLFDVSDPSNVIGYNPPGATLNPVIASTESPRKLYLTNSVYPVSKIQKITFHSIVPSQHDYLIISHPLLMKPASGYNDPVRAYAAYRASEAGGAHDTLVVDIHQLYNQFNYGEISPLAIHRFMRYLVDGGSPKYLFIIGKGLDWFHNYHRNPNSADFTVYKDLVPSAGVPASDMYYTIGLGGTTYEPAVPTGRISASSPAQVAAYLNKVKETESLPFDALWRKKIVHLSGGLTEQETVLLRQYLEGYASIAEDVYLGGLIKAQAKNTTNVGELVDISAEVNTGVNLITFFGHSSAVSSDFEIGFATNPSMGYNNPGKYPMFLINGCFAGEFFGKDIRYGEDWILAANKGAVGFVAHTSYGFTSTLRLYSDIFYRVAYGDSVFIRKGVGDIQKETARRYMLNLGDTQLNLTQVSQMLLLGDPALKIFGAGHPDYEVNNAHVYHESLDGEPVTAYTESFALKMVIRNFGLAKKDSLHVRVTRILENGLSEVYDTLYAPVYYQDTLTFSIRQERFKGFGSNVFQVEIDPDNFYAELNEENNLAVYALFIPLNVTRNLFPYNYAIVNTEGVTFTFASTDILGASRDFELEVDTVDTFNSSFRKSFVTTGMIAEQDFQLLNQDSLVYYWRTRFKDPQEGEVSEWVTSSFVYIENSPEGWAQVEFPQYLKNELTGLVSDPALKLHGYIESTLTVDILTFGNNSGFPSTSVSVKINNDEFNPSDISMKCRDNTINLIAFDKQSNIPYTAVLFNPFDGRACGRRPQVINSYRSNQLQTAQNNDIFQYMINVPEGDSVVLFTIGDPGMATWPAAVKNQFALLGISSTQLESVLPGEPVVIFAKKGAAPGSALFYRPEPSDTLQANEQELLVNGTVTGRFDSGTMTSNLIGPAQNWQTLITQASISEIPQTDIYSFDVKGASLSGVEQLILQDVTGTVDLSAIDAELYPYLRLYYKTTDPVNLTPPQLVKWIVHYTPVAEGVLIFDKPQVDPVVQEGESWTGSFGFRNISQHQFSDSLMVRYTLFNQSDRSSTEAQKKIKAPNPGETTAFPLEFKTLGKPGLNDTEIFVNPRVLPELYYENNLLFLSSYLTVLDDRKKPVLEVTVDGRYLANGDFVSPNPQLVIKLWDENEFIKIDSPADIQIRLNYPGDPFATNITFDRPDVAWFAQTTDGPFRVEFNPVNLPEGSYRLEIEASDASGNASGSTAYTVEFEIVYDQKVVLLAPYPNPSASEFRFDLVMTGNTPPDQLQLTVVTPEGRVVNSVTVTDFYIGTNRISWNGTDHAGHLLPNGLYLYRLTVAQNGQPIPLALPEGERFLKGGYGKLVLRR
jgi:hypothetical protein